MNQRPHAPQFLRRRKFMLILPLFVAPFLIVIFMLLGGGSVNPVKAMGTAAAKGINPHLPDAYFKKGKEKSKLSLYEEASKDSVLLAEKIKNDPYYLMEPHGLPDEAKSSPILNVLKSSPVKQTADSNEKKIMQKLAQLKAVMADNSGDRPGTVQHPTFPQHPETSQLEKLLSGMKDNSHDPEMDQLSSMLDKVMAIQHPELLKDSLSRITAAQRPFVFPVRLNHESTEPAAFGDTINNSDALMETNRFFELIADNEIDNPTDNDIEAMIPETQTLVSGATIKLRLLNDVRINGHLISKGQLIYGTANLSGERLKIQFSSIRAGGNILPVSLEAYDLDGLSGIYIPGSINRDVSKQSLDQSVTGIGLTSLDPSLGAQAAGAGIQAAKTLFSRKARLVRVTIYAGYRLLLKDNSQKTKSF